MATVKDKLTKEGEKFLKELAKLDKLKVKIGFQQGVAQYEDEDGKVADVCDIAMFNEVGTSSTPSRPFMRDSCDKHEEEINKFYKLQVEELENGTSDAEKIMKKVGVFHKGLIQTEIVEGEFVPNKPSTIKRKGSSKPLIDTGKMRQSVNFTIVKK